mgnify:CR=1 FL=1
MSAFVLKLIAVASMLIDHAAYSLFLAGVFTGRGYVYMRAVGRIAFPIFAYMIVNGFEKTHDVRRYFSRLALFAVISQPVYRLAFTAANYGAQALTGGGITLSLTAANITAPCLAALIAAAYLIFACRGRVDLSLLWVCAALVLPYVRLEVFGVTLLGGKLNVFYMLAIGLALIAALDALRRARGGKGELFRALMLLLAALSAALLLQKTADYGWMGLALIAALYLARSRRVYQAGVIVLWCVFEYAVMQSSWFFALYAMLAAVPVLLYSGRLGARMRGFYLVYPVHLGIFYVLSFLVSR